MTTRDIFELRRQGRIEEAYDVIRHISAEDKRKYTTLCMFWTAHDILKKRIREQRTEEAERIFQALRRVAPNTDDREGKVETALNYDAQLLTKAERNTLGQHCPSDTNKDLSRWGEELAAAYLESKGYRILERDWRSGHRDIDIIARTADELVFVEVKTRRTDDFGEPYKAVNYKKQRNLRVSINHYLHRG